MTAPRLSVVVIGFDMARELPRTVQSLLPPYQRGIDPGEVEDGSFLAPPTLERRASPSPNLDDRIHRASPLDYGRAHLDLLRTAPNVQLLLHANLLRLESTGSATAVRRAVIGTLDGRRGHVDARWFVLAAGGIENARMLLLSNDVSRNGLGNDRDLVGRYFMDHPRCRIGALQAGELERLVAGYGRPLERAAAPAHRQISVSPAHGRSRSNARHPRACNRCAACAPRCAGGPGRTTKAGIWSMSWSKRCPSTCPIAPQRRSPRRRAGWRCTPPCTPAAWCRRDFAS